MKERKLFIRLTQLFNWNLHNESKLHTINSFNTSILS